MFDQLRLDNSRSLSAIEEDIAESNLFALLQLDPYLIGTHLEGGFLSRNVHYMREHLKQFSQFPQRSELNALLLKLESKLKILEQIEEKTIIAINQIGYQTEVMFEKIEVLERKLNDKITLLDSPYFVLDNEGALKKVIIRENNQEKIIDIGPDSVIPEAVLSFIKNRKNDYRELLWKDHPVLQWLESLGHKPDFREASIDSLEKLQQEYIHSITREILEQLKTNKSVLIPGGWQGVFGSGHAMLYELIECEDGSVDFIIYNSGGGLEKHEKKPGLKEKNSPLKAYKLNFKPGDMEKEKKIAKLITELLTPKIAPILSQMWRSGGYDHEWESKGRFYNANRVYNGIEEKLKTMDATPIQNPISLINPESQPLYTQGQLSGTCSLWVLRVLLKANMGPAPFKEFEYYLGVKSIFDYFNVHKDRNDLAKPNNLYDTLVRRNLLRAIRKLSLKTEKLSRLKNEDGSERYDEADLTAVLEDLNKIKLILNNISIEVKAQKEHLALQKVVEVTSPKLSEGQRHGFFKTIKLGKNIEGSQDFKDIEKELLMQRPENPGSQSSQTINPAIMVSLDNEKWVVYFQKRGGVQKRELSEENDSALIQDLNQQKRLLPKKDGVSSTFSKKTPEQVAIFNAIYALVQKEGGEIGYDADSVYDFTDTQKNESRTARPLEAVLPSLVSDAPNFNAHAFFKEFQEKLLENNNNGYSESVIYAVEQLFLKWPFDEAWFDSLSTKEAEETLCYLHSILRLYGKNIARSTHSDSGVQNIVHQLLMATSYTVLQKLYNNPNFEQFGLRFLNNMINGGKKIPSTSLDPAWDAQEKKVQQYIEDKNKTAKSELNIQDFFDIFFLVYLFPEIEQSKTISDRRISLYDALKKKNFSAWPLDVQRKYDVFLQFRVMVQESQQFFKGSLEQFSALNAVVENTIDSKRIEALDYEKIYREEKVEFYDGKKYAFGYYFQDRLYLLCNTNSATRRKVAVENYREELLSKQSNELMLGRSDPEKSKVLSLMRLSVSSVLAVAKDFFESNLEMLKKESEQSLVLWTFFSPDALLIQVENNPRFLVDLRKFLEEAFSYYSADKNYINAGVVMGFEIEYFLTKYLKYFNENNKNLELSLNSKKEIENVLVWLKEQNSAVVSKIDYFLKKENDAENAGLDKKSALKLLQVYFLQQSIYQDFLNNPDSLQYMLNALFETGQKGVSDPVLEAELVRTIQTVKPLIKEAFLKLEESQRKALIFNLLKKTAVAHLMPKSDTDSNTTFDFRNYPHVVLQYRESPKDSPLTVIVDLSLGRVETSQGRVESLPHNILSNAEFSKLFKKAEISAIREDVNNDTIYSFFIQNVSYRVIKKRDGKLHIQFKPKGENNWFERVSAEDIYSVNAIYANADTVWWRETGKILRPTDYACSKTGDYILKVERIEKEGIIEQSVYELDTKGEKTGYRYLSRDITENKPIYELFSSFEAPDYITIVGDLSKTAVLKIKLPRYDLEWQCIKRDNQFVCQWSQNTDFELVIPQPQIIDGFPHTLYMKNSKTGETIVLMPKQAFYVDLVDKELPQKDEYYSLTYDRENKVPKKILQEKSQLSIKDWPVNHSQRYYTFEIQKNDFNNPITAKTPEGYLQLAYVYLANHQPLEAMVALKAIQKLGGLQGNRNEVDLIYKILKDIPVKDYNEKYYEKAFFKDPETLAVRLYAAFLLSEQKQKSFNKMVELSDQEKRPRLPSEYKQYEDERINDFYENEFLGIADDVYQDYKKVLGFIPEEIQLKDSERFMLLKNMEFNLSGISESIQKERRVFELIKRKKERAQLLKRKQVKGALSAKEEAKLKHVAFSISELKKEIDTPTTKMRSVLNPEMLSLVEENESTDMQLWLLKSATLAGKPLAEKLPQKDPIKEALALISLEPDFLKREAQKRELELKIGKNKIEEEQVKIKSYVDSLTQEKQKTLKDIHERSVRAVDLEKNKAEFLALANKNIVDENTTVSIKARRIADVTQRLSFEDLIGLYLQADKSLFQEKTKLNDEELKKLYLAIHQYLEMRVSVQRSQRILHSLEELEKNPNNQSALIKLGDELSIEDAYDARKHPELLIFECFEDMAIRPNQAAAIVDLVDETADGFSNVVKQFIMGFGKSKLVLPLAILKRANGTNLSAVALPEKLFGPGFSDLDEKTYRLFGKRGFPLIFNRDSDDSVQNLETLYERLQLVVRNREYVVTTPESILSLQLKYLELLKIKKPDKAQKAQIGHLENILKLIQYDGDFLIEESDSTLSEKKELNYTLDEEVEIDAYVVSDVLKVFDLFSLTEITLKSGTTVNLQEIVLREKEILEESDWEHIISALAEKIMTEPSTPLKFLKDREGLKTYLLGQASEMPACLDKYTRQQRQHIDLMKGSLSLLQVALKRKPGEFYGFPLSADYEGNKELGIPYFGNNEPNERAKFSLYETLFYTVLLQKQKEHLSDDIVLKFIVDLYASVKQEMLDNVHLKRTFEETSAALKFKKLTGQSLSKFDLETDNETENKKRLAELKILIKTQPKCFNYILKKYILNQIKMHPRVLRATRSDFVSATRSAAAISGTTWNKKTYHPRFVTDDSDNIGVDGETLVLLKQKNPAVKGFVSKDPNEIIEAHIIQHRHAKQVKAFIDVGAIFERKTNIEIARLIAEKIKNNRAAMPDIKWVLYFNAENQLCALSVQTLETILINSTDPKVIAGFTKGSQPNERFTFYDQLHTTGIDILQDPDAIGILSVDKDTKTRDFLQGAKRLRALNTQTLEVLVSKPVFEQSLTWNIDTLIDFVADNQTSQLVDVHLKSALSNMSNVLRQYFLEKLYQSQSVEEKIALRGKHKAFFEFVTDESPSEKFGNIETIRNLEDILDEKLKAYQAVLIEVGVEEVLQIEQLMAALQRIKEEAIKNCLKQYKYSKSTPLGQELEVEKQKQQQSEVEKEKEKEKERQEYLENLRKKRVPEAYKAWNLTPHSLDEIEWSKTVKRLSYLLPYDFQFSDTIFVSENFEKTYKGQTVFLDDTTKPVNLFLVIKENNQFKIMFMTLEEFKEFEAFIKKEKAALKAKGIDLWVATPHNTVLCGTSDAIEDNQYFSLLSQIQYFNADIDRMVRSDNFEWLLENASFEKLDFLETQLLVNHPEQKKYWGRFKKVTQQKIEDQLKNINKLIKIDALFNAIRSSESLGAQAVSDYLKAIEALQNENLKKLAINFTTIDEGSQKLSLLSFAVKHGKMEVVQKILESNCVLKSYKTETSPIMLALQYQRHDILKMLLKNASVYPYKNHVDAWREYFDKLVLHDDSEVVSIFLQQMGSNTEAAVIEQLIDEKIKKWTPENYSTETVLQGLEKLARLADNPWSVYEKYFLYHIERSSPEKIKSVMDGLYAFKGEFDFKNELSLLCGKIKRPDVFLVVCQDPRFLPDKKDIDNWIHLLNEQLKPGVFLYVKDQKDNLAFDAFAKSGKFPLLVYDRASKFFTTFKMYGSDGKVDEDSYMLGSEGKNLNALIDNIELGFGTHYIDESSELLKIKCVKFNTSILEFLMNEALFLDKEDQFKISEALATSLFFEKLLKLLKAMEEKQPYKVKLQFSDKYIDMVRKFSKNEAFFSGFIDFFEAKNSEDVKWGLYDKIASEIESQTLEQTPNNKILVKSILKILLSPYNKKPQQALSLLGRYFKHGIPFELQKDPEMASLLYNLLNSQSENVDYRNALFDWCRQHKNLREALVHQLLTDRRLYDRAVLQLVSEYFSIATLEELRTKNLSRTVLKDFFERVVSEDVQEKAFNLEAMLKVSNLIESLNTEQSVKSFLDNNKSNFMKFFKKHFDKKEYVVCEALLKVCGDPNVEVFSEFIEGIQDPKHYAAYFEKIASSGDQQFKKTLDVLSKLGLLKSNDLNLSTIVLLAIKGPHLETLSYLVTDDNAFCYNNLLRNPKLGDNTFLALLVENQCNDVFKICYCNMSGRLGNTEKETLLKTAIETQNTVAKEFLLEQEPWLEKQVSMTTAFERHKAAQTPSAKSEPTHDGEQKNSPPQ